MGWHCEATRVLGPETSSQTKSEELPEIYKEHSELREGLRTGPVFFIRREGFRSWQPNRDLEAAQSTSQHTRATEHLSVKIRSAMVIA